MTAKPRQRLDRESRRAQLVELGVEMLSSRPIDEVVVDDIAEAAGISRGLLFHYFPTKRDYLVAVATSVSEQFLEATLPDPDLPMPQQLRSSLEGYLTFVERNRPSFVALIRGAVGSDPQLQALYHQTREAIVEYITNASGGDELSPRARVLIRGWVGFVEEAAVTWLDDTKTDPESLSRDEMLDLLEATVWKVLELAGTDLRPRE
jgi:AcrR family transcriptional regulator